VVLIDDISLNRWVKNALLKFGGTIMPKLDKVIEVREGSSTGELLCTPISCKMYLNSEIIFETNQKTLLQNTPV
jgi:hypothetical protein